MKRPGPRTSDLLGSEIAAENNPNPRRVQSRKAKLSRAVSLYDGLRLVGRLIQRDRGTEAVLADGTAFGLFNTEAQAVALGWVDDESGGT